MFTNNWDDGTIKDDKNVYCGVVSEKYLTIGIYRPKLTYRPNN